MGSPVFSEPDDLALPDEETERKMKKGKSPDYMSYLKAQEYGAKTYKEKILMPRTFPLQRRSKRKDF